LSLLPRLCFCALLCARTPLVVLAGYPCFGWLLGKVGTKRAKHLLIYTQVEPQRGNAVAIGLEIFELGSVATGEVSVGAATTGSMDMSRMDGIWRQAMNKDRTREHVSSLGEGYESPRTIRCGRLDLGDRSAKSA
jgi:hypothetical protein